MEKKPRRQYSPEEKVRILRLHLLEGKAVSEICEREGIHPTLFYQWQRTFFENGAAAFRDYIHLNPSRARLVDVTQGQSGLDYPWSSIAGGYALLPHQRAKWLAAEQGLATMGVEDTVEERKKMVGRLDKRAAEELEQSGFVAVDAESDKRGSNLRRGWYWGKQAFAENLLKLGEAAIGRKREARSYDASPEMKAHGEQQAQALLEEGLRVANLAKEDLIGQGCTEPRKVFLAGLLWKKTTVSQAWIAEHLGMKNAANVSRVIHRMDLSQLQEKVSGNLRRFVSEKMKEHEH